jgi:ATP-dependent RNA helicase DeaD
MGFREELEALLEATPAERRTHLVSATFPHGIRQLAKAYQRDPLSIEGTRLGDANQDIEHVGYLLHRDQRYAALVNLLLLADGDRTLVFVERRADALEVASRLEEDGFAALPLSGELAQSQRERTLAAFRSGRAQVLVATDVAARGLDVPDVATVIHTAPPIDAEVYTHRSGRTGRAGNRGKSVLFAAPNKRRRVERIVSQARVEFTWLRLPGAADVRAHVAERAEARLREELAKTFERGLEPTSLERAQRLIADHDPAAVVAALLERSDSSRSVAPRDVSQAAPTERRPYDNGPPRTQGQREFPPRRPGGGRSARFEAHQVVRFFMNCGSNQGATPGRVLASICRRGQVQGSDIGSIAIHPNATTFDVQGDVVERFEYLVGRRDSRDPHIFIRRDRGRP